MPGKVKTNRNPGVIAQLEHADSADAHRELEAGLVIGANKQSGNPGVHNDISSAVFVGEDRHLLVTNRNATTFQYVTFGDSGVSAGSATNGVPIPPNNNIRVCSGPNEYVRGSSTDLHVVEIED